MSTGKHTVIYSDSQARIKDIFKYLGYYPECDFIFHMVFSSDDFVNIPDDDLPLCLWHAGEAFIEDTSNIKRDFVYITGNALLPNYFNVHDIAASKIWKKLEWSNNKSRNFLFLNGKDIGHRRYLLAKIFDRGLHDYIWSYIEKDPNIANWYNPSLGFSQQDLDLINTTNNIVPHLPFGTSNQIRSLPQNLYKNTYCSIIGETTFQHYNNQTVPLMLTEKTYSAIANLHMFIIAGPLGSLQLLRDQGFETFSDLWDESYDTCRNEKMRLDKIFETIIYVRSQNMKSLYEKCKDRLLHNQNLIYSIDIKSRVAEVTQWLIKDQA